VQTDQRFIVMVVLGLSILVLLIMLSVQLFGHPALTDKTNPNPSA
jgi:hypothetical protein